MELKGLLMHLLVTSVVLALFRAVVWFWPGISMTPLDRILVGTVIPLCLLPGWGLLRGAAILLAEWNRGTSHVLFSLPVSRIAVVLAKGLAVVTELAAYALLLVLSVALTWAPVGEGLRPALAAGFSQAQLVAAVLVGAAIYLLALACFVSLGLLLGASSHLVGRRLALPVGVMVAAVWLWMMVRLNSLLLLASPQLNGPRLALWHQDRGLIRVVELELSAAPPLAAILLGAAALVLAAWVLERADVN